MSKLYKRITALIISMLLVAAGPFSVAVPVQAFSDTGSETDITEYSETLNMSLTEEDSTKEALTTEDFQTGRLIVESVFPIEDSNALEIDKIYDDFYLVQYVDAQTAMEAYYTFLKMWWILSIQPDGVVELEEEEVVPVTEEMEHVWLSNVSDSESEETQNSTRWPAEQIGIDAFQEFIKRHYTQLPIVEVAVLDTGIDSDLDCMAGRLLDGAKNYCSSIPGRYPEDDHGHGTMVGNIIVDNTFANVQILPIKVMNADGEGYDSHIVNGILYAIEYGVDIINLSIGGDGEKSVYRRLMDKAEQKGIAVLVAAGNEGEDVSSCTPANIDSSITISAVNKNDKFSSTFSNYGQQIDFCAPGEEIPATGIDGQKYLTSGTSFAAPYATAAFANIKSVDFTKTGTDIYNMVKEKVVDLGTDGWDAEYGYGRIELAELAVIYERDFVLSGDVNQDEMVNSIDAYMILQYIVGKQDLNEVQVIAADADKDGTVSVMDVLYILQKEVSSSEIAVAG